MPIVNYEGSKQLHFGTGDILVSPGLLKLHENVGVVCFTEHGTHGIGEHFEHDPSAVLPVEETPVRMTFDKVESIDVVIWALEETKRMMLEKINTV